MTIRRIASGASELFCFRGYNAFYSACSAIGGQGTGRTKASPGPSAAFYGFLFEKHKVEVPVCLSLGFAEANKVAHNDLGQNGMKDAGICTECWKQFIPENRMLP